MRTKKQATKAKKMTAANKADKRLDTMRARILASHNKIATRAEKNAKHFVSSLCSAITLLPKIKAKTQDELNKKAFKIMDDLLAAFTAAISSNTIHMLVYHELLKEGFKDDEIFSAYLAKHETPAKTKN